MLFFSYKNSALATFVSIMGGATAATGVAAITQGFLGGGLGIIAVGLVLMFLGSRISKRKAAKQQERANQAAAANTANTNAQAQGSETARTNTYTAGSETTRTTANTSAGYNAGTNGYTSAGYTAGANGYASAGNTTRTNAYTAGSAGSRADDYRPGNQDTRTGGNAAGREDRMPLDQLLELAQRYKDAEDYHQEITLLQHGSEMYPRNAEIYNMMGIAWRSLADYVCAGNCYKRAIELDPSNPVYVSNYAIALMLGGNPQEALQQFEKAMPEMAKRKDPNYPTTLANYALALAKCGYSENAVRCLRDAEKLGYPHIEAIRSEMQQMGIYYH